MRDLERDLRDLFERRADEAVAGAPHRMPDEVHRRIRRRMTRSAVVAVAAVVVLIVSLAGIFRLGWVGGSGDARPASPATSLPEYVVASGETVDDHWTLVAIRKSNEWCLEFRLADPISRICEGSSPWEERLAIGTGYAGDPAEGGLLFLYGAAPSYVEAMDYELEGGERIEIVVGTAIPLPDDARFNPFHGTFAPQAGTIVAYSENRQTPVFRQHFAPIPPPGPPPMTGLTPVLDHFGNSVGEVRGEEIFAPPPLPGAEDRTFSWTPPGLAAGPEEIRRVTRAPLTLVWTEAGDWWAGRPQDTAQPDELRVWWDAYPVDANIGVALGETFYASDANGNTWAELGENDAVTLRHAVPGEGGRTVSYLRVVALTRIPYIAPEAWAWWASRPPADAPDAAFLEWWDSYPSA